MKIKYTILIIIIILLTGLISGYLILDSRKVAEFDSQEPITVGEFLQNPVYDELVKIYGEVSYLGERNQFRSSPDCPCFSLYSDDKAINIWYDGMKISGPIERMSADISEIKNGQWAIVIGELKSESQGREFKDFWAKKVERAK